MVKCSECGFLSVRSKVDWMLKEAVSEYRDTGKVPGDLWNLVHASPICFAMTRDLLGEAKLTFKGTINEGDFQKVSGSEAFLEDFRQVLNCERKCNSFTKWQQGFTPKEHREMLDRQEWRDWQARQRNNDRHWRIIELIVLVLAAGGFTILGSFIGRGSIP